MKYLHVQTDTNLHKIQPKGNNDCQLLQNYAIFVS